MKTAFFAFAAIMTVLSIPRASQAGPSNISGMEGRLLSVRCEGAYVGKLNAFRKTFETACNEIEDPVQLDQCVLKELKDISQFEKGAVLTIDAIGAGVKFAAEIEEDGKQVFSSTRLGTHADGEEGVVGLFFFRDGVEGEDPFLLELDGLSDDGKAASAAFVPVKRRILSDLFYYFPNGCSLNWE